MTFLQKKKYLRNIIASVLVLVLSFTLIFQSIAAIKAYADDEFQIMLQEKFPESYWAALTALHEAHPTWIFEAYETGVDWNDLVKNEMVFSRNLISNTIRIANKYMATPSSWKSTEVAGAFDWAANKWVVLSGSNWYQLSIEALYYAMDPRNWLDEGHVFAFEQLGYNEEYQTYEIIKTMLENTFMDCDYATVGGSEYEVVTEEGTTVTLKKDYATVILEAAKLNGVSATHLASRIVMEQGRGTYNSTTGQYEPSTQLVKGSLASDGKIYYNFYNMGAGGSNAEAVLINGTNEAMKEGWDTQYKAVIGGASKLVTNYISVGQDTRYFQKFNVVNKVYWKQYQQNVMAPYNEGYTAYNSYVSLGLIESAYTFRIPIINNLPETPASMPTKTGNPNYKLSAITVNGTTIEGTTSTLSLTPTFDMDTDTYSIIVPYETNKINLSATAIASTTSKVSGTGTKELKVGNNQFQIVCTSEFGTSKTYTVNVTRREGSMYMSALTNSAGSFDQTFDKLKYEYTMTVDNSVETIDIQYATESDKAYVEIRYADTVTPCTGGVISALPLAEGDNIFYIDVYASESDKTSKKTYTIKITKYTATIFEQLDLQLDDVKHVLNGFSVGDTVATALGRFNVINGSAVVKDSNGKTKSDDATIGTGDTIQILDGNGNKFDTYTILMYGDVNGDSKIDLFDYAYMKKLSWGNDVLSGIYLDAADVFGERNGFDLFDYAYMKKYTWKQVEISQKR